MKNHHLVAGYLFLLLLAGPLVMMHGLLAGSNASLSSDEHSKDPLSSTLQALPTQLSPGQLSLVRTVDVRNMPDAEAPNLVQTMVPSLHPQGSLTFEQAKNATEQPGFVPPGESSKTVTTSQVVPDAPSSAVNLILGGVPGASPNPCGCSPPDTNDAVGPRHVFEVANTAGIIYLKNGTVARNTFALSAFFGVSASLSDPQVLFDTMSQRWFASIIDVTNNRLLVAISTSNDPTRIFNIYSALPVSFLPDQPYIGTSNDKFVISTNDFSGSTFAGVQYWIVNKAQLVNGSSTAQFSTNTPDSSMFTLRPVRHLTTTTEFYLVTDCIGSCVTDPRNTANTVELLTVNGLPPGTVSVTSQTFSISTSIQPPNAVQPGTKTLLRTNDNRILSAVWESGNLWLSLADACVPAGDRTTRSCVHLIQAAVSGNGTATKKQDFEYAISGAYLFFPSLTLYRGQVVVVYGESSATLFPSVFVTGRLPSDPSSSLEAPVLVKSGTADDTSGRYGDYFGAGTDPNPTNNSTFWVSGEYRASSAFSNWNTVIGQVGSLAPSLTISASPSNITTTAGIGGNANITVTGYRVSGSVTLNATASSIGLSCILNPSIVVLNISPTSKLTCSGSSGHYNVTVTGAAGSTNSSILVPTVVQPSQSLGGTIVSIEKIENVPSYALPGLMVLMVALTGTILLTRPWRKRNN